MLWNCKNKVLFNIVYYLDIADVHAEKRLHCGHTVKFYNWKRNGVIIRENSKYSNTTSEVLTLLNVDRNSDGKYRCEYHHYGWQSVDFYLVVQGKIIKTITIIQSMYIYIM